MIISNLKPDNQISQVRSKIIKQKNHIDVQMSWKYYFCPYWFCRKIDPNWVGLCPFAK